MSALGVDRLVLEKRPEQMGFCDRQVILILVVFRLEGQRITVLVLVHASKWNVSFCLNLAVRFNGIFEDFRQLDEVGSGR